MSTAEKSQKISIGFHGGQVLAARVTAAELAKLQELLGKSGGWHQLTADDGTVTLDLTRVDYLMIEDSEHRVGF